jgi:hypothetical protein
MADEYTSAATRLGAGMFVSGRTVKTGPKITIDFNYTFGFQPVVVLSSFAEASDVGVDHIDTITQIGFTSFDVSSQNMGETHYIDWMAYGSPPVAPDEGDSAKKRDRK